MRLTDEELYVVAFVFHWHKGLSEKVFRLRHITGSLEEIQSLCLNRVPNRKVVTLLDIKLMWYEERKDKKVLWVLPPSFSEDVIGEMNIDDLIENYFIDWMTPYNDLKIIYIPVEECNGHWHLMVVSLEDETIYHPDPFIGDQNKIVRHNIIRRVDDWTRAMDAARTQQTEEEGARDTTQSIDGDDVFDQVVGGPYKNRVYGKGAFKTQTLSSASVTDALKSGASGSSTDNEVQEQVHRLNLEIQTMTQEHQRQLEVMQTTMEREHAERIERKAMDQDAKLKKLNKRLKKEKREQQQRVDAQITAQIIALRAEFMRGALHPSGSGTPPPTPDPPSSSSNDDDDDDDDDAADYD